LRLLGPIIAAGPSRGKDARLLKRLVSQTLRCSACARRSRRAGTLVLRVLLCWLIAFSAGSATIKAEEIELPPPNPQETILIDAGRGSRWTQGAYDVWLLDGRCLIQQGATSARADQAVLWIERAGEFDGRRNRVIAYLEGNVRLENQAAPHRSRIEDRSWLGTFESIGPLDIRVRYPEPEPQVKPPVYARAQARLEQNRDPAIKLAQFAPLDGGVPQFDPLPPGTRRLRVLPRSSASPDFIVYPNPAANEWVAVSSRGVTLIVDGLPEVGQIDLSADRVVVWMGGANQLGVQPLGQSLSSHDQPLEFYLEGNIVFRQGERVVYADRMYYDVRQQIGIILNAEALTPAEGYAGLLRLRADIIRQIAPGRFQAENAFVTSSRLGEPSYRLETLSAYFEDIQLPVIDPFTGNQQVDPITGQPLYTREQLVTAYNNFLFIERIPVFYWPVIATDLDDPTLYIRRLRVRNDQIFGTQILTDWDPFQLLGVENQPEGVDWDISFDYLSERGFGAGTTVSYTRDSVFGIPGPTNGFFDAWGIDDSGNDNLGSDRMSVTHPDELRGRVLFRQRQLLPGDFRLSTEFGLISDRNFLEQYFENEWDEGKDQSTGLELKRLIDNMSLSLSSDVRLNDFFTQTEWLPRADHFWLGQPLLFDRLTWYEHSNVGYARLRTASTPTDPGEAAIFSLLPWEADVEGQRFATRHEIDLPLTLGPVEVTPYALGEVAQWGETLTGENVDRAYGQVGVRASIPLWNASPNIESELFNVHGVAHKVTLEAEYLYADANRELAEFPLYDALDDDAIEHFRRRFAFNTFGGTIPARFDERSYALRSGLQRWVTSPSTEIADDLTQVRLGLRQRWQTKRGPPENRRIIDWIVLDTEAIYFPDAARDNFDESLGLLNYDFRWHVGDRVTLISDGGFDFFDQGQQIASVGGILNSPPRMNLFLGFHSLQGPINSQVLAGSLSYQLSPKWIANAGTSLDVAGNGNIGQSFALTRIGESFLVSLAANVDSSKDNVGVSFAITPRFIPRLRYGQVVGSPVPVAGIYGLE
jgi:hypothetical protein